MEVLYIFTHKIHSGKGNAIKQASLSNYETVEAADTLIIKIPPWYQNQEVRIWH